MTSRDSAEAAERYPPRASASQTGRRADWNHARETAVRTQQRGLRGSQATRHDIDAFGRRYRLRPSAAIAGHVDAGHRRVNQTDNRRGRSDVKPTPRDTLPRVARRIADGIRHVPELEADPSPARVHERNVDVSPIDRRHLACDIGCLPELGERLTEHLRQGVRGRRLARKRWERRGTARSGRRRRRGQRIRGRRRRLRTGRGNRNGCSDDGGDATAHPNDLAGSHDSRRPSSSRHSRT